MASQPNLKNMSTRVVLPTFLTVGRSPYSVRTILTLQALHCINIPRMVPLALNNMPSRTHAPAATATATVNFKGSRLTPIELVPLGLPNDFNYNLD